MNKEKIDDILGTFLLANIPEIITQEEFDDVKSAIKDLQKKAELGEHYKHLYSEVKKQKDTVVECCNKSIKSINDKLAWIDTSQTYPNEYQRIRLKAFRTKCKEILRMLGEIK